MIKEPTYFDDVEVMADNVRITYYYTFLKSWVTTVCPTYKEFDKFIFWFTNGELEKVEVMKDTEIVKSYSRENWLDPMSTNLDSKDPDSYKKEYTDQFLEYEDRFVEKIKRHPAAIVVGKDVFVIDVGKDYHGK